MYKKKQHKPPPSAKAKAKTEALLNDLAALLNTATKQPSASQDTATDNATAHMVRP